jgi:predicted enzyme related to lactoylglutathione lyase
MDKNIKAFASYSIKDAARAKDFYEKVLGLSVKEFPMPNNCKWLELDIGDEKFMLYEKEDHQPATHTVLNLEVPNIGTAVQELSQQGVKFEHYEGSDQLGVMHDDGPLIAWFKDPDGNFISVIQEDSMYKGSDLKRDLSKGTTFGEAPLS